MKIRIVAAVFILVFASIILKNNFQPAETQEDMVFQPVSAEFEDLSVQRERQKTLPVKKAVVADPESRMVYERSVSSVTGQAGEVIRKEPNQELAKSVSLPPTFYPGNTWGLIGAVSPMERNNILSQFHLEQGFTAFKIQSYYLIPGIAVDLGRDSMGYDWNNKVMLSAGPRLVRVFPKGIVRVGALYGFEQRPTSGNSGSQIIGSLDYWFGWGRPSADPNKSSLFPGSTWGIIGNTSPFERGNTIAFADFTQGINIFQRGNLSVIPFVKLQSGADSKGYDWNNKVLFGSGVKLVHSRKSGTIDLALHYLSEKRLKNSSGADMLSLSGSYWFGWNPKRNKEAR
jgi:hypothetical protein